MVWVLLAAAVAPAVFLLHYFYVRDRYEREPLGLVLKVFFISFLTVIPAAIVEGIILSGGLETAGLIGVAIASWAVIALSEEFFKYVAVRWLVVRHPAFNEVYDGIIYCVAASLGFAVVENIMYVFLAEGSGILVASLRALLSVPGHALWGVMMGYYIGLARMEPNIAKKRPLVLRGIITAIFWHGLYDFFAFGTEIVSDSMMLVFGLGVLAVIVVNWVIAWRMIRHAQELSPFNAPHPLSVVVSLANPGVKFCHHCGLRQPRQNPSCEKCGYKFPR
jgi:RsiW-degrading membrane proteinase PrsW (M82 family)